MNFTERMFRSVLNIKNYFNVKREGITFYVQQPKENY